MILISINILDIVLDLISVELSWCLLADLAETLYYLVLMWVVLCMLIIKYFLILGKRPTQGLDNIALTAEVFYKFYRAYKKICLSLHYNSANTYLFVSGVEIIKYKARGSEIKPTFLCLGGVSKDFSVDNMKKTGLYGYFFDFWVDFDSTDVADILDIYKYLMVKNNIK